MNKKYLMLIALMGATVGGFAASQEPSPSAEVVSQEDAFVGQLNDFNKDLFTNLFSDEQRKAAKELTSLDPNDAVQKVMGNLSSETAQN